MITIELAREYRQRVRGAIARSARLDMYRGAFGLELYADDVLLLMLNDRAEWDIVAKGTGCYIPGYGEHPVRARRAQTTEHTDGR